MADDYRKKTVFELETILLSNSRPDVARAQTELRRRKGWVARATLCLAALAAVTSLLQLLLTD
jgi:hypothetical protein